MQGGVLAIDLDDERVGQLNHTLPPVSDNDVIIIAEGLSARMQVFPRPVLS